MENLSLLAQKRLEERGVSLEDMAYIAYDLQIKYNPTITLSQCQDIIQSILEKREVSHTVLTAIAIDKAAEKGLLDPEVCHLINQDEGLYGIDEIVALSIVNVYGSIALTNFGYLDKVKPGIIGKIDELGKNSDACHTFLDDVVAAIIASAASKIAHMN